MYVRMFTPCHHSSDFISQQIFMKIDINVRYDNTSNEFAFQGAALKVKVTVTIFRKYFSSL